MSGQKESFDSIWRLCRHSVCLTGIIFILSGCFSDLVETGISAPKPPVCYLIVTRNASPDKGGPIQVEVKVFSDGIGTVELNRVDGRGESIDRKLQLSPARASDVFKRCVDEIKAMDGGKAVGGRITDDLIIVMKEKDAASLAHVYPPNESNIKKLLKIVMISSGVEVWAQ